MPSRPPQKVRTTAGRRPRPPAALLLAGWWLAGLSALACKKETESLVIVALSAAPADTTLTTVSLTAATVVHTFSLPSGRGLSATPISFGLYLPSSITGQVSITASATGGDAGACSGYVGNGQALILEGGTANVDLTLVPGNTCTTDGGSPHGTSPPSLARCTEYSHDVDPTATCVAGDGVTDIPITDVAFTHDGKLLFTAGEDSRVKVWNWNESTLSLTAEGHELDTSSGFTYVAVSPDDKLIAVGSPGGTLTVWNIGGTWSVAANLTGITGDIYGVAFSPDSQTLYAVDTGGNLTSYGRTSMAPAQVVALNPIAVPFVLGVSTTESDGNFWLGVGYANGDASLIHVVAGAPGAEFPFTVSSTSSGIYTLTFSPDGLSVESGSDNGSFGIWSVPLPSPATARSPAIGITTDWVYGAGFHPAGKVIAIAAGSDDDDRQLGIWNLTTGLSVSAVSKAQLSYRPSAVVFSPDGTTMVAGERECGKIIVCAD